MNENTPRLLNEMMTKNEKISSIRDFIINNVDKHPKDIARLIANTYAMSRVTAIKHLQALTTEGIVEVRGKTKDRSYVLREIVDSQIPINITPQIQEDVLWREEMKPLLRNLPENIRDICAHGFTEMFNNVLSHSGSKVALITINEEKGSGVFS